MKILPRQPATELIVTSYSAVARVFRYRAPHDHRNISARQRAEHRIARSLPEDDKSVRAARAIEILERARIIEPGRRQEQFLVPDRQGPRHPGKQCNNEGIAHPARSEIGKTEWRGRCVTNDEKSG